MRLGMTDPAVMDSWLSRITGPEQIADTYRFTLNHDGKDYYAVCPVVESEHEQERYFEECRHDLANHVGGFVAYGCGWPGHEFDGDTTDPNVYLECVKKCGAAKLYHQILEVQSLTGAREA